MRSPYVPRRRPPIDVTVACPCVVGRDPDTDDPERCGADVRVRLAYESAEPEVGFWGGYVVGRVSPCAAGHDVDEDDVRQAALDEAGED